ncbi:MAG: trigger factor [Dehalococcoidia bacterium]|nr:trigger factor [Dehalococcoidia bacterium]
MKVSTELLPRSKAVLNIEGDQADLDKSLEKAYQRLANRVSIPGFRRGKAPRNLIERVLGKEAILDDALNDLIPDLYQRAVQEQDLKIIGNPSIEVVTAEPPVFKATVPLRPTVELGDYHLIRIAREPVEAPQTEVDKAMERLRSAHATFEPVERAVALDDMVTMDVAGKVDDKVLVDQKAGTFRPSAGLTAPVPGFSEQLVGMAKGEEKEFTITLPADYSVAELAGKPAVFKVKVIEVKQQRLPELNDEFAKSVAEEFQTLDALRQRLAANLKAQAEDEARKKLEDQAVTALVETSKVDYPEELVEQEVHRLLDEQKARLGESKVKLEDYLSAINKTEEQLHEELHPTAEKGLTRSLVLGQLAEVEKIEVTPADIDAEVERLSSGAGAQAERLRQALNSPAARHSLEMLLLTRKTLERLVKIATGEADAGVAATGAEAPGQV